MSSATNFAWRFKGQIYGANTQIQYFLHPLTKQGTKKKKKKKKKNPDTQFYEKWVGKNSPNIQLLKILSKALKLILKTGLF